MEALARLRNSCEVMCVGDNRANQSGACASVCAHINTPTPVAALAEKQIMRVLAAHECSYALTASGEVTPFSPVTLTPFTHTNARTNTRASAHLNIPTPVTALAEKQIMRVLAAYECSYALTASGEVINEKVCVL